MAILKLSVSQTHHDSIYKFKECVTNDLGRIYKFDCGDFMSVTTALSLTSDNTWLDEWKQNVGEQRAADISRRAAARGTTMHDNLEKLARGETLNTMRLIYTSIKQVIGMHKVLTDNLTHIHSIESPLCCPKLGVAGRCDLIGEWHGKLAMIDYKTSTKIKTKDDILSYFIQTTIYCLLAKETLGLNCEMIVILIALPDGQILQFCENPLSYRDEALRIIELAKQKRIGSEVKSTKI